MEQNPASITLTGMGLLQHTVRLHWCKRSLAHSIFVPDSPHNHKTHSNTAIYNAFLTSRSSPVNTAWWIRELFPCMGIPVIKIRRSWYRLTSIIWINILVKRHLNILRRDRAVSIGPMLAHFFHFKFLCTSTLHLSYIHISFAENMSKWIIT